MSYNTKKVSFFNKNEGDTYNIQPKLGNLMPLQRVSAFSKTINLSGYFE